MQIHHLLHHRLVNWLVRLVQHIIYSNISPRKLEKQLGLHRLIQGCSPGFLFAADFAPAPLTVLFTCFPEVFGRPLTGSESCTTPLVNGASSLSSSLELLLRPPREGSLIICGLLINCNGARVA